MQLEKATPTTPALAGGVIGIGSKISSTAIEPNNITTILALKQISERVAFSFQVAERYALHAGLGPRGARS